MNHEERWWRVCFALCCALLIAPLFVTEWLPLVDLPQHAAQLAIGKRWTSSAFDYPRHFEFNWFANSIVPYGLTYILAVAMPIATALKLALCVALIGIPVVTWRLVLSVGGNRWWAFAAFPVAYGYAFSWGFVSFVLAAPVGLWLILVAIQYRAAPSRKRALGLAALCYLLFASHVLVLAYAGLAALLIIWLGAPTMRARMLGSLSLASVVPIATAWWLATKLLTPGSTPQPAPLVLQYGFERVFQLFSYMTGAEEVSLRTMLPALLFLALPFALGARPAREAWRGAPLACALAFHFLVPLNLLDTAFVSPRFSLFVMPGLLVALHPVARERRRLRFLPVSVVALWLLLVTSRYYAFGIESRGVSRLIDEIEPNRRVLSLIDNPRSAVAPWFPYLHIGCWYQVRHGGIADFSFAEFFPNRFRYRAGMDPPLPYNIEWSPQTFRWSRHGGDLYDYFLVRRTAGARWHPFVDATTNIELVASVGDWQLYRQIRP